MLVDDVGLGIEMIVPDMLEQHRAGDHAPGVAEEQVEDLIFAGGEVDRPPFELDPVAEPVDERVAPALISAGSSARAPRRPSASTRASSSDIATGLAR